MVLVFGLTGIIAKFYYLSRSGFLCSIKHGFKSILRIEVIVVFMKPVTLQAYFLCELMKIGDRNRRYHVAVKLPPILDEMID